MTNDMLSLPNVRPPLEIRVLGDLTIVHEGRAVPLPASKKTRALLAYLVVTGRAHPREQLCDLLWPGPNDPRAALRWSLTKLRDLVDVGSVARIVADRDRIGFVERRVAVDLTAVRAIVAGGVGRARTEALRAAAAQFRGDLFEGLDFADCYRYHQFCASEREAARSVRVAILAALSERLEAAEALRYARERVAVDPLAEAAHVKVVKLLAALGHKNEALEAYETCRRILSDELHATPSSALLLARAEIGHTTSQTRLFAMNARLSRTPRSWRWRRRWTAA